jgi:hypothetical protein
MLGNVSQGPEPFERDRQSDDEDQAVSEGESPWRVIDVRRLVHERVLWSDDDS